MKTQVELTEKEIIEKLLAHYEYAIKEVEKSDDWLMKAIELSVNDGLCICAEDLFALDICETWFIKSGLRRLHRLQYIYAAPCESESLAEALECIQYRIDFLKNALKELQ